MKNIQGLASILMVPLMMAPAALAQTGDAQAANDFSTSITIARCQYTPTEDACRSPNNTPPAEPGAKPDTLAQVPRRFPGPCARPRLPRMAHPRGGYPDMWVPPNGRYIAIGALIGFGLGAAPGAHAKTDQHLRAGTGAIFAFGGIGALRGAVVGAGVPPMHARNPRRRLSLARRGRSASPDSACPRQGRGQAGFGPA